MQGRDQRTDQLVKRDRDWRYVTLDITQTKCTKKGYFKVIDFVSYKSLFG